MAGRLIGGKYELLRKIAAGGMAEVYLAKQTGLVGFEKLVVIKRILPHLAENEEFVRMFLDEARTAADLRHPNVVQIYEVGEDQGTYFIAMEFLHGQDLRRILRRQIRMRGRVPLQHALQMVVDAAAGLHYAHQKADLQGQALGIIHRDISPQNVIVTYDGGTKIVDFGIAKAASQSTETRSGVLKGKYSYMSPEQASGEKTIDQRTDQFALGIVAYELTTATRLFKYPNEIMTLHAIIECRVTPPADVLRGYPPDLNDILLRALSRDRSNRYRDLEEFASEIEEFLAREGMVHSPQRVAGYMQKLFDEVIEQEAELGHPLISEEPSSSAIKRATANSEAKKRPDLPEQATEKPAQATVASRPRTIEREKIMPEQEMATLATDTRPMGDSSGYSGGDSGLTTVVGRLRSRFGIGIFAAVALIFVVTGIWLALGQGSAGAAQGRVVVETNPAGATVVVDGEPFGQKTPTVISSLEIGRTYVIKVFLLGYDPQQREVRPREGRPVSFKTTLLKSSSSFAVGSFDSTPQGASVHLNGEELPEETPFELPRLKVGEEYTAVFSLEGYPNQSKKFRAKRGKNRVSVELKKGESKAATRRLTVITVPRGASIEVDGYPIGEAPLKKIEVESGSVVVVASMDGYETATREVDFGSKDDKKITIELSKKKAKSGSIELDSVPSGVAVYRDGELLGKTPLTVEDLPPGSASFRFKDSRRHIDSKKTLTVRAGKTIREVVKLPSKTIKSAKPRGKGVLKVVIKGNWADVYINGKKQGQTPMKKITLPAGSYKVRLVNREIGKDITVPVRIEPNQESKIIKNW